MRFLAVFLLLTGAAWAAQVKETVQETKALTTEEKAEKGDMESMARLGAEFLKVFQQQGGDENLKKAVQWLSKAARKGHPSSQSNLGMAYLQGWIQTGDSKKMGVFWLEKAVAQHHPYAMNNLGLFYATGNSTLPVEKALDKAFPLFKKAAEMGYGEAQANLAVFYRQNQTRFKLGEAKKNCELWLQKAADQGVVRAQEMLKEGSSACAKH